MLMTLPPFIVLAVKNNGIFAITIVSTPDTSSINIRIYAIVEQYKA
jgi:hypothetical protein